jgi:AcrR family transcriptional regulator
MSVAARDARDARDGRTPGSRGRATRERLLEHTAALLEERAYRNVSVIEIARRAATSPATFYQYFTDVEEAVLELAHRMATQGERLPALIREADWRGKAGSRAALELVDGFLALWEQHAAVLRVVDLATAEGDLRFQNIRTRLLNEVTVALRDVIDDFCGHGRHAPDVDPMAQAAVLVSMLAHVAAHRYGYEFWGIKTDGVRASTARIVFEGVTGRRAPT